ncbi:MAG: dihydropteroate synthase, partial [Mycobacteriales bacterium]
MPSATDPLRSDPLRWGGREMPRSELAVMAIVNATPDSFYDRGRTWGTAAALDRVAEVLDEGADVVDIGGIKAAPGGEVDAAEELERVLPVVEGARARHPNAVISVDTWRADVADVVLRAGADVINDAWGGVDDALTATVAGPGARGGSTPPRPHEPPPPPPPVWDDDNGA